MTNLELTRLCAETMGFHVAFGASSEVWCHERWPDPEDNGGVFLYDPLHIDSQAMALVKRFKLEPRYNDTKKAWFVTESYSQRIHSWNADLNRAIVQCVAKMKQPHTT